MTQLDLLAREEGRKRPSGTPIARAFPAKVPSDRFDSHNAGKYLTEELPYALHGDDQGQISTGKITRGAWLVYTALRSTIDEEGVTVGGLRQVEAQVSTSTIWRRMRELEKKGFIELVGRDRQRHNKRYRCMIVPVSTGTTLQLRRANYARAAV